jgi:hypothetical protein
MTWRGFTCAPYQNDRRVRMLLIQFPHFAEERDPRVVLRSRRKCSGGKNHIPTRQAQCVFLFHVNLLFRIESSSLRAGGITMPYTLKEFSADLRAMPEVSDSPEFTLPESEWKSVPLQLGGETKRYIIREDNFLAREAHHFEDRYSRAHAPDYCHRFQMTRLLLDHQREQLQRDGIMVVRNDGQVEIKQAFLEFLLDGFREPQPPRLIATHPLISSEGEWLPYSDIIQSFEKWCDEHYPE